MKKGIFIGRTTLDILFYQKGFPEENRKAGTEKYTTCVGGNACNAAITYSLLGGSALLVTSVGDSLLGKSIKEEVTAQYGVQVVDLLEDSRILPFLSAVWINSENESRTLWGGHQADESMRFSCWKELEILAEEAAFFMTDDQFPQIIIPLFECAEKQTVPVVYDAERWSENTESLIRVSSEVIASADCRAPNQRDLFDILRASGVSAMAVTDGERPVRWESEGRSGRIIPMQAEAVDTLGAGDILHGAYCYFRFCRGMAFEEALEKACELSSISVMYPGPRTGIQKYTEKLEIRV